MLQVSMVVYKLPKFFRGILFGAPGNNVYFDWRQRSHPTQSFIEDWAQAIKKLNCTEWDYVRETSNYYAATLWKINWWRRTEQ